MSMSSSEGHSYDQLMANSYEVVSTVSCSALTTSQQASKRKRCDSNLNLNDTTNMSLTLASPPKKKKRTSSSSSNAFSAGMIKKNTVYCICKTKYDQTK